MITITDKASFEAAIAACADSGLRRLLATRLKLYSAGCLLDLTMLAVLGPGDTGADVERETGMNPLINPIDGERYPSPTFHVFWDYLARHAGWYEWICCTGNEGYATILLIPDAPDADPELLSLCQAYADEVGRGGQP